MGFGSVPVNITAKINGTTVFNGDIITDVDPPPNLPDLSIDLGVPVFTWTHPDVAFTGTATMEITVNNSVADNCFVYFTDTLANYLRGWDADLQLWRYGGAEVFGFFYFETIDNPADPLGPWISGDPQSNVEIDGFPVEPHPVRTYPGQYYWRLYPQQVMTCVINIAPGYDIPAIYNNTTAYVVNDQVSYNNNIYKALQNTTGNLPTNSAFWRQIGMIG